ncbi:MAG: acyl carrier protein [Ignavibacteriae bacterium]|nr:MAG: acyl carrier protein [Ignavibacteriota bacterium]
MEITQDIIKKLLINELFIETPEDKINIDDGLQSIIGLDSLGFIELRVLCEKKFGVKISDENFTSEHFSTIRCLAQLIDSLKNNGH